MSKCDQIQETALGQKEGQDPPLVTVGIPVYNEESHIRETLESLASIDYGHMEYVISDNASTDRTAEICEEFCRNDSRFHLHRTEKNRGAGWNFCHTLAHAHGEFFMWASGHDLYHRDFVRQCVARLQGENRDIVLVAPRACFLSDGPQTGSVIPGYYDTQYLPQTARFLRIVYAPSHYFPVCGLYRRSVLESMTIIRKRGLTGGLAPDQVLLLELSMVGEFVQTEGDPILFVRRKKEEDPNRASAVRLFPGRRFGMTKCFWHMMHSFCMSIIAHTRNPVKIFFMVFVLLYVWREKFHVWKIRARAERK